MKKNNISKTFYIIFSSIKINYNNINNIKLTKGKIIYKDEIIYFNKDLLNLESYLNLELKYLKNIILLYLSVDLDKLLKYYNYSKKIKNENLVFKILIENLNKNKISNINLLDSINSNLFVNKKINTHCLNIYNNNCFVYNNYLFDLTRNKILEYPNNKIYNIKNVGGIFFYDDKNIIQCLQKIKKYVNNDRTILFILRKKKYNQIRVISKIIFNNIIYFYSSDKIDNISINIKNIIIITNYMNLKLNDHIKKCNICKIYYFLSLNQIIYSNNLDNSKNQNKYIDNILNNIFYDNNKPDELYINSNTKVINDDNTICNLLL